MKFPTARMALLLLLGAGFILNTAKTATAQEQQTFPPKFDTTAWFIDTSTWEIAYVVVDVTPGEFLGLPAVTGVWSDGESVEAWGAIPTSTPGTWLWLAANGPAGTVFPAPANAPHLAEWKDGQGNGGIIITTP